MTKFSNLEKNFGLSSEKNVELNSTSREAVIAVETRDHLSNGVSPKNQRNRGNKGWLLFFICVLLFGTFATYAQESKLRIAVIDLDYINENSYASAMQLTSIMTTKLVNTKKYVVIERSKIEQVIKELELQSSQNASARAAEIGKLLGVNKIITGEYLGIRYQFEGHKVSLRLIDVESGSIEAAITKLQMDYKVAIRKKNGKVIDYRNPSDEEFADKLLDDLLN